MKAAHLLLFLCISSANAQFVTVSPEVAQKLLMREVKPIAKCPAMPARIIATVVLTVGISVHGDVIHPVIISGPKMLQQSVLNAVRQYKYQPYKLNGEPIAVRTMVSVHIDSIDMCSSKLTANNSGR
jgi:protein TonB